MVNEQVEFQELDDVSDVGALEPGDKLRISPDGYGAIAAYHGKSLDGKIILVKPIPCSTNRLESIKVYPADLRLVRKSDGNNYLYLECSKLLSAEWERGSEQFGQAYESLKKAGLLGRLAA